MSVIIQRFLQNDFSPMSAQPAMLKELLTILDDSQAIDVKVIDVSKQTSVTDFMVITSGRASRHVIAIANTAIEKMKAHGVPALSSHGFENGDWVLVDFGDYVLHVMQADARAFYNLEGIWHD